MRQPTSRAEVYRWYDAVMRGEFVQITGEPQAGWFRRKLVKGGPFVGARIWMHQVLDHDGLLADDERLRCEVNGREVFNVVDQWTYLAGNPISEDEFSHLLRLSRWAARNAEDHPAATPDEKVNFLKSRIPF